MALSDKNILITPNIGAASDPKIVFSGADASTAAQNITLTAYPTNGGTLSFDGSTGQLFSVTNSMTGTIFSVNDVSGIPSVEVLDTGLVKLAQYSGNVLIGTGTDTGLAKLQVYGSLRVGNNGFNSSPGGTAFSHTIAGNASNNRVVNFDGNGSNPSVWWTNGATPLFAIDGTTNGALFWAYSGGWQQQMSVTYGTVNVNTTLQQGGNQVLHAGNYTSYSPTLTGGSASGTWGISVTGNAATATTATTATYLSGTGQTNLIIGKTASTVDINAANDTGSFSVRGDTTYPASMSFHRAGAYAINIGLSTSNEFVIGGWSASSNAFKLTGAGAGTFLSTIAASNFSGSHSGTSSGTNTGDNPGVTSVAGVTPIVSSGGTTPSISHATSGATAGTYNNVTVNTFGHVTAGSNAGYLTGESDTLATVTGRGATTATAISITNATASSSITTGALVVTGGVGISGTLRGVGAVFTNVVTIATANVDYIKVQPASGAAYIDVHRPATTGEGGIRFGTAGTPTWTNRLAPSSTALSWLVVEPAQSSIVALSLDMTGNLTAAGNITAYSDIRLKTDLKIIPNALFKVKQLTGYTYIRTDSGVRQTGLVAQDVQKVLPEAVSEGEYLSLAYGNMVGLLVEAIKEQQTIIDSQESRIARLENLVSKLIEG